jgi:NAD/NADP transhydrogenase alpha subunit
VATAEIPASSRPAKHARVRGSNTATGTATRSVASINVFSGFAVTRRMLGMFTGS